VPVPVAGIPGWVHTQDVAVEPPNRVFLADKRGGNQYLRATWHAESSTIVFSHWNGEVCVASTPVALAEASRLLDLQVRALTEVAQRRLSPGTSAAPLTTLGRLRSRLRPKLAEVIDASTRFLQAGREESQTSRLR
jgi:hypothetical protein